MSIKRYYIAMERDVVTLLAFTDKLLEVLCVVSFSRHVSVDMVAVLGKSHALRRAIDGLLRDGVMV